MSAIKVSGVQGLVAAAVAVTLTWVTGWGFVDSTTRVGRWVQAAQVASELVSTPTQGAGIARLHRASLIQ